MDKLSNYLQFVGTTSDFIGFLILFFNTFYSHKQITMRTPMHKTGGLYGGRPLSTNDQAEVINNAFSQLTDRVNGTFKDLIDKLNERSIYTRISWGLISFGFLLQAINYLLQLL